MPRWGIPVDAVEHVHDTATAIERARPGRLVVLLPAAPVGLVRRAAATGRLLPRKATSYGPKPRVGLVSRRVDGPGTD